MKHPWLILLASAALYGQSSVQGPVLGWVWDASREAVRPVQGIPGSSLLGPSVDVGMAVAASAIARNSAILVDRDQRRAFAVDLAATAVLKQLDVPPGAGRIMMSPNGSAAVFEYTESRQAVLVSGLPEHPVVRQILHLDAEGMPAAWAVRDDASGVLAAYAEQGFVLAFDLEGNRWKLNHEGAVRSLAFLDRSADALLAAENGVWLVSDVMGNAEARLLYAAPAQAVAATADRRFALVVEAGVASLVTIRLEDGVTTGIACACEPKLLDRMGSAVFRVNELSDQPLWLLDLSHAAPRMVFVPAETKSQE
ncbi:MAG: hypothetical protein HY235_08270 [Acidobacteria bacterium]|nr:hypothetical protein [Acidobacteriota bacterium]